MKPLRIIVGIIVFLLMLPLADAVFNFLCRTTRHYATDVELSGNDD